MNKIKNILYIVLTLALIFTTFYVFNVLNQTFPNNIFMRVMNGLTIVLVPAMIALIIAYLVDPFKERLMVQFKFKKMHAVIITVIVSILVVFGLVGYIVYFLYQQSISLYASIVNSNFLEQLELWSNEHGLSKIYLQVVAYIESFDFLSLLGSSSSFFQTIGRTLSTFILIPIFLWYFLYQKELIFTSLVKVFPSKVQEHITIVGKEANTVTVAYFKSKIISMLFLFVMFLFVFATFGMPIGYLIMFALLITVLDLIPYLGPTLGMLIPIVYIFANQSVNFFYIESLEVVHFLAVIILLVVNTVVQAIQGNIIMPKVAGKEMNINPLLILVSMLFFGSILGIWGIVLAIPICGILIVIVKYVKGLNAKENLETHLEKEA